MWWRMRDSYADIKMKIVFEKRTNNENEKFPYKILERYLEKKIMVFRNDGKMGEGYLKHIHDESFYMGGEPNNLYTHTFIVYWGDVAVIKDEFGNKIYGRNII